MSMPEIKIGFLEIDRPEDERSSDPRAPENELKIDYLEIDRLDDDPGFRIGYIEIDEEPPRTGSNREPGPCRRS